MAVTLKHIAERTGKSVTTVSRALAGYGDVSESTRIQVQQVATELGYEPNITARQLQKQRTDTIALVLPTFGPRFSDPFFSEFLAGVGNESARHGFDLLVSTLPPGDEEEVIYLRKIRSRRVDGFIVVRTRRHDARIRVLQEHNVPFAVFGRTEDSNNFPYVDENSEEGVRRIVTHLINLGHTRLAWMGASSDLMLAHYRSRGFVNALTAHNLSVDENLMIEGDLTQRSGREIAGQLLDMPAPPTAIAACNDLMALGAISAAQERGLVVGKDVSITGFDDIPLAEHSHPPLTTVHQPVYKIGTMVCDMLIKTINGENQSEQHVVLQPSIVIRKSTGSINGKGVVAPKG